MADVKLEHRWLAIKFFYESGSNARAAAAKMRATHRKGMRDWRARHILHWVDRLESAYTLTDAPRVGRPTTLPPETLQGLANILAAGVTDDEGKHHGYHSFDEACAVDPIFDFEIDGYNFTQPKKLLDRASLLRMLQHFDPHLCKKKELVKWQFTDDDKKDRVSCAYIMLDFLSRNPNFPDLLCFLDEASVWLNEQTGTRVWCHRHSPTPIHPVPHHSLTNKKHALWYIAVNSMLGVFGPYFTSGTTEQQLTWPVRIQI